MIDQVYQADIPGDHPSPKHRYVLRTEYVLHISLLPHNPQAIRLGEKTRNRTRRKRSTTDISIFMPNLP
jgi:hypothetical protein